jgi:hypothetical protein
MEDAGCRGQGWDRVPYSPTPDSLLLHPITVYAYISQEAADFKRYFRPACRGL